MSSDIKSEQMAILGTRLGAQHRAAAVQKKRRMVANPGADFQDTASCDVEPKRCKMLKAALVMPKIMLRSKRSGCEVYGLRVRFG